LAPTEEAVIIYRDLATTNPAYLGDLACALGSLGEHHRRIGSPTEALVPAEEAVTIYRDLAITNPAYLGSLAGALDNLNTTYRLLGRLDDEDATWMTAFVALDARARAELRIRQAASRPSPVTAAHDLTAVLNEDPGDEGLHGLLHDIARMRRAEDLEAFDAVWREATGEVPDWLSLDGTHLDLVSAWVDTATYADEAAFAEDHAMALLGGPTALALRELGLLAGDADAHAREAAILVAARDLGFAAVYEPIVANELVGAFLAATPEEQLAMLDARRDELVAAAARAALDRLTSEGRGDGGLGAGLLRLAAHDLDHRTLEALSDDTTLAGLVDDLVGQGRVDVITALGQTIYYSAADERRAAIGLVTFACALSLADATDEATKMLLSARRIDDAAVQAFFPRLASLIAVQPRLAVLVPVFAEPLEPTEESD
jgi:hypothetical protein